ncbi:MAG: hypothetical protein WCI45_02470 [Desulfuromonadales bacterium]
MNCPKCKARIGVMKHEVILDFAVVQGTRCIICGYWSQPYPTHYRQQKIRGDHVVM